MARLRYPLFGVARDGHPYIDHKDCSKLRAEAANHIENLEAQNLALLERNEKLEFREMELREALTPLAEHPGAILYGELDRARAVLAKAPYQRTGESE